MLSSTFKFDCQRCGKKQIITDFNSGEIFCGNCGCVINDKGENFGYESNHFDGQKDTRRTGSPVTLSRNDFGLSTIIDSRNKDANGHTISFAISPTIKRIRFQDNRSQTAKSSDKSFMIAFDFLQRIQDKLGVSDNVKENAAYIYRKAVEKKITKGRQIYSVIAASMYIACRNTQTLRNLNDISKATNITRRNLTQSYRAIVKQLDLRIPVVDQTSYILKLSSILNASVKTKNLALKILKKAEESNMIAGRDPIVMAAVSIYYSSWIRKDGITQTQIANAAGVTMVTIRNRFQELEKIITIQNDKSGKNCKKFKEPKKVLASP